jgi:hypothetical protein
LIVDPFTQLKANEPGTREPVPEHKMPVTADVPAVDAVELSTVTTDVLSFAVVVVVPGMFIPVST